MNEPPGGDDRGGGVQVVGRAIDILLAVAELQRTGASMPAINDAVGLNRSTCSRLVRYLAKRDLLEYDEPSRTYAIGKLAFELGLAARTGGGLVATWQPRLDRIRAQTGMTVYLVARSEFDVVCMAVAEATSVVRAVPLVLGQRLPLGIGAGSLAILASCSDEEVAAVMEKNCDKFRDYAGRRVEPDLIWRRVRRARERGYAESSDTVASGVCGLGLAVPPKSHLPQLAVSVSSLVSEFAGRDRDEIAGVIRASFTT